MIGIDLSHHNGNFNFCSNAPYYDFAIVKATEGRTFKDKKFHDYVTKLKNCGKIIGCYHFVRSDINKTETQIIAEVNNFIRVLNEEGLLYNSLLCLDWEVDGDFSIVEYMIDYIRRIYNKENIFLYTTISRTREIIAKGSRIKYKLWLADYITSSYILGTSLLPSREPVYPCTIWQFTSKGVGICGEKLDVNYTELNRNELINMYN